MKTKTGKSYKCKGLK